MPELPEVETSKNGILPFLKNEIIDKIIVRNDRLRYVVSDELKTLSQVKISDITRRAKYLIIHTTCGDIIVHLGMSGSLKIIAPNENVALLKHDHIDLVTQSGTILRYNDPRRFGLWLFCKQAEHLPMLKKLGVEPLTDDFSSQYLYQKCKSRNIALKKFIMDNAIVVGVGNIYACESLFLSKLSPEKIASTLTQKQCERLVTQIKQTLAQAIKQGGTTLKDFKQPDGKLGYFAQELLVYGKKGQECPVCSSEIQAKVIGGRNSFFCNNCQK